MKLTSSEILQAIDGQLLKGNKETLVTNISTDSRTLQKHDLFVALVGDKFDGHDFLGQIVGKGAIGAVVSKDVMDGRDGWMKGKDGWTKKKKCEGGGVGGGNVRQSPLQHKDVELGLLIKVDDTLQALGDIATHYRRKFDIPVIAVTGSNGKTTTKDMVASVLSQRFSALKSEGSFNNLIGVPLTLFQLSAEHQVAVLELGISIPGEMRRLSQIAQPNFGVITNIGPTHLEFLKSLEGVAREKGVLLERVRHAVLNADDKMTGKLIERVCGEIITFGESADANVKADKIQLDEEGRAEFSLVVYGNDKGRIILPSLGIHNVSNALAASSVGILMGLDFGEIKNGLANYQQTKMRMQTVTINHTRFINDAYNSNPVSLKAAIDFFSNLICAGKKIAILADMLELGEDSEEMHQQAGKYIPAGKIDVLITVGDKAAQIAKAAENSIPQYNIFVCATNDEAAERLREVVEPEDTVLLKGSRGMKLEEVMTLFSND